MYVYYTHMKTVSVYELRDNLSYYLDLVANNQTTLVVEKYHTPTAIITPFKAGIVRNDPLSYFGFLGKGKSGVRFVNRIRRNQKERERVKRLLNRHG